MFGGSIPLPHSHALTSLLIFHHEVSHLATFVKCNMCVLFLLGSDVYSYVTFCLQQQVNKVIGTQRGFPGTMKLDRGARPSVTFVIGTSCHCHSDLRYN